ncbi:MAG TPA: carbon-nitrogen hydrolase family protein [Mucilaginibacter sp.]|jgi:predicted amidohydrolase
MKIALATPPFPISIDDGLHWVEKFIKQAADEHAEIVCFPESYIPGMRGMEFEIEEHSPEKLKLALQKVCGFAKGSSIAVILPMDWDHPNGISNVAFVISDKGEIMGSQTKNQLDPTEDEIFAPGTERQLFELNGVKFGITICHEGFRYPEATRWAAVRGAKIVFHPHCTGSNIKGFKPEEWGHKNNTYHEKAMMMRALENTIYFASVNYALEYQESATSLIGPDGECIMFQTYGEPGLLIADIDTDKATGELAKRYKAALC